jgi:hypothetical protein
MASNASGKEKNPILKTEKIQTNEKKPIKVKNKDKANNNTIDTSRN